MKIKTTALPYETVRSLPRRKAGKPEKPSMFFRTLMKTVGAGDLRAVRFTCNRHGMERLGKNEPAFILMNHSAFLDLEIASSVLYPRPFNIVCTSDGFVGKEWLMRKLGCIPTEKFVSDITLVRDLLYTVRTLKSSVLMYPEASYSFDGTATPLPESVGKCVKLLGVPLVMIRTYGAFQRDPLYNGLRKRDVTVTADMDYLLSPEEIAAMDAQDIQKLLCERFSFDNFAWQKENSVRVTEPFRAEGLNRVLYKCPHCLAEGQTEGHGTTVTCHACGKVWELTELGEMRALDGETEYPRIPDWYRWERECVRRELLDGTYRLDIPVDIRMLVDYRSIYEVGEGRLVHDRNGFHLTGCGGALDYTQKPLASYSLYADYFWYELGDMVCIGNHDALYYCFPRSGDIAAKTRLATEELYKIVKNQSHAAAEA